MENSDGNTDVNLSEEKITRMWNEFMEDVRSVRFKNDNESELQDAINREINNNNVDVIVKENTSWGRAIEVVVTLSKSEYDDLITKNLRFDN